MEITDEFIKANSKETMDVIAQKLRKLQLEGEEGAVLITLDDQEVIGFITTKEVLDSIAEGKNPAKMPATELMNTDFVEVLEDETLGEIIPVISKQYPNAIVVINKNRNCVGYFSKNDYKDAMAALGIYNKTKKPENSNDWRTKGIAMSSLGKRIDALKCYEKSLLENSNKEKAWTSLAKRLERINRHKDAIMCLDKAISLNSDNDDALVERGQIYAKENTQNLAIKSYIRALEINPNNAEALMFMGMEQANLGDIEEAMISLDRAVTIKGNTAELWFRKGTIFEKTKKFENALECYNQAIEMDESYEEAWYSKCVTLDAMGNETDALECLEKIVEINPNNEIAKDAITSYNETKSFNF
jgi:tetratricopeptide (TPR) repeat protein